MREGVIPASSHLRAHRVSAPHEGGPSQDRSARRDFHGGNTPRVEHEQSLSVSASKHAGVIRQRGDNVLDDLGFAARIRLLVRDIQALTADEADSQHDAFHVPAH